MIEGVNKQVTNGSKTAVIGFLCASLSSSTVQHHDSVCTDVHAHVQGLVSVVKMVTVLEGGTIEEQHSAVSFFVGKRTQCKGYSYINASYLR
jgi:hypothetical protein